MIERLVEDETGFQGWVIELAQTMGWLVVHHFDSRHTEAGFPDLIMLRGDCQIVAELKTESGRVATAQQVWLDAFTRAGVAAYVWRPSERDEISAVLR